MKFGWIWQ